MNKNDQPGFLLISYPITKAFSVPISNLANILSIITETCVIFGTKDRIHFKNVNFSLHKIALPYQIGPFTTKQVIRYILLIKEIIYRLFLLKKSYYHVFFFMELSPIIPMFFAKILKYKVYWILPSQIFLSSEGIFNKTNLILSKIGFNLCNYIILYSPNLVSYWNLEQYKHKILIAGEHFIDFTTFTITIPYSDRPLIIGFIGRISKEKGIQNFNLALPAILNQYQNFFVLIGGDGPMKESIESTICDYDFTDRVDMPGWISHDELSLYLNRLRLLVLPSYTEGLPNIILEAMACGTPVLATSVGAIPDVIIDGETGFIMKDNSPECIAKNVIRALNCPDLKNIAERGKIFVENNYSFEKTVEGWKSVIHDVLES